MSSVDLVVINSILSLSHINIDTKIFYLDINCILVNLNSQNISMRFTSNTYYNVYIIVTYHTLYHLVIALRQNRPKTMIFFLVVWLTSIEWCYQQFRNVLFMTGIKQNDVLSLWSVIDQAACYVGSHSLNPIPIYQQIIITLYINDKCN